MINDVDDCVAVEGVVVDQIKGMMRLLHVSPIKYVPREANRAAHSIADFVARRGGRFTWFEVGPPWLMRVVSHDFLVTNISSRDVRGAPITRGVGEGVTTACHSQFM